ncbi:hypothetical protein HAX54_027360 [Datura stramonium]|uniref:Uncharacterized protein n=1 Tax=Datura stramonium TaxID=4076 RepID=A0ABS8V3J1_DATST|nr:hypothetical protein [Datura stramonium]
MSCGLDRMGEEWKAGSLGKQAGTNSSFSLLSFSKSSEKDRDLSFRRYGVFGHTQFRPNRATGQIAPTQSMARQLFTDQKKNKGMWYSQIIPFRSVGKTNASLGSTNPSKTYFAAYEIAALVPSNINRRREKIQKAIRPIRLKEGARRGKAVERQLVKMPIYLFLEQLNVNRFLLGSLYKKDDET